MKKVTAIIFAAAFSVCALLLVGCAGYANGSSAPKATAETTAENTKVAELGDLSIVKFNLIDCKTEEILTSCNESDKLLSALNIINNAEDTTDEPTAESKYCLQLIDGKSPENCGYFLVYIENDTVYYKADESHKTSVNDIFGYDFRKSEASPEDIYALIETEATTKAVK